MLATDTTIKTNKNSIYTIKQLLKSVGGIDNVVSAKLKEILLELKNNNNVDSLVFKESIGQSYKSKKVAELNDYVKALVCLVGGLNNNNNCNSNKHKISTIKGALLVEKLIQDKEINNQKNKFNKSVLKKSIGEYVNNNKLDYYLEKSKELIDVNFSQFSPQILSALEILESKTSKRTLVDCQLRINTTDASIFKEFDTKADAIQYVRLFMSKDLQNQQRPNNNLKMS